MTQKQKCDLVDSLTTLDDLTAKAETLIDEVAGEYFHSYDPSTPDGKMAILWNFSRCKVFASLLVDVISGIRAELPTVNWVESLKAEEDNP